MSYTIFAKPRTALGKRARDEREARRVPAVMYGHGIASQALSVPQSEFIKVYRAAGFSSLIDLAIDAQAPVKVLIKDVQLHPLSTEPIHVDFYQVRMDEEITAEVPLKFIGESDAVKTGGGTLVKSMDHIEVTCLPGNLPHEIEVDLSALKTFDDAISIADLKLSENVHVKDEKTLTIATVARPLTEEELKKLEETAVGDIAAVKTEGEEKKAAEEAKKAEEQAAEAEPKAAEAEKNKEKK